MAEGGFRNSNMQSIEQQPPETEENEQTTLTMDDFINSDSPTHVLSPASSLDSEESLLDSDEDPIPGVDLGPTLEDNVKEEQIEKLKEFLSEARGPRADDLVTQKDAETVRGFENMQIAGTSADAGLASRLESAARANLEIEKQTASGYYPSETVYLQEHTLKEVLDEASPVLGINTVVAKPAPQVGLGTPVKSPRAMNAEKALKHELDYLFEERAGRL